MDFKNSLAAGLQAAQKARNNKEEIFSVIRELSDSIRDYSEGRVSLEITSEQKLARNQTVITAAASAFTGVNPYINYEALSLITRKDQTKTKEAIAEWRLDESDGYPCVISYGSEDVRCRNKEMLVKALNQLMSNASTGEVLLKLMNIEEA